MSNRIASRTYGTVSVGKQKEMTGLEFVQGLADGTLPLNTIAKTLGYDIAAAERGRVVVTAEPKDIHLNPAGTVHGVPCSHNARQLHGARDPVDVGEGRRLDDPRVQDIICPADHSGDWPDQG
jgi:hypothetical protein